MSDPPITRRRLVVIRWTKKKGNQLWLPLNLVQRLSKRLYDSRNAFLHGNKLTTKIFIPLGLREGVRLLDVAPLIYLTALEAEIGARQPRTVKSKNPTIRLRAQIENIFRYNTLEHTFCRPMGWK